MGIIGNVIGQEAGGALGKRFGGRAGSNIGRAIGGVAGNLLPFQTGGRVPGKKGAPKKVLAHGGEYILPVGVKPTKAQKAEVAKRRADKKAKKAASETRLVLYKH